MFWPGWEATIDGLSSAIEPAPGSGLITLEVPAGNHEILLRLTRTPIRLAAELISLLAVLGLLWIAKPARFPKLRRRYLYILLSGLLLAAIFWLWPLKPLPVGDTTWDFAQMAYLHHDTAGVTFENGAQLQSYSYSQEEVSAGDELIVTLNWLEASPGEATLVLATPAVNRFDLAPLLASQSQPIVAGPVEYRFTIPENGPAGLYVPRLTIPGAQPLAPSGRTRGDLFLRPFQIVALPQPAGAQPADLDARALQISLPNLDVLEVQLQWLTQEPLTQNYNFSLRLIDADGIELAKFDGQPGFGFQPSSGWPTGQWVNDWLALPLPDDLQEEHRDDGPLALIVRLYDVETGDAVLTRRLGDLVLEGETIAFQPTVPNIYLARRFDAGYGRFRQASYNYVVMSLPKSVDRLELTLYWEALANGTEDFFHFVHLVDPATGEIFAQHDSMPRNNSYPTSQWSAGEIVADPLFLNLTETPSGEYVLYVGLYRNLGSSSPRLPVSDDQGRLLHDDRIPLPDRIVIDP